MRRWTLVVACVLAIVGLVLLIVFSFNDAFYESNGFLNADLASKYGGLVGGLVGSLFSLAGIVLLYETITAQSETFHKQQFETKFFEMIRFHRENVERMKHVTPSRTPRSAIEGAAVFSQISNQFKRALKQVKICLDQTGVDETIYTEKEQINIAYIILFFGVSENAKPIVKKYLGDRYNEKIVEVIVDTLAKKKARYNAKIHYFGGHQVRLAHYFRNLYQAVTYVDSANFLKQEEKYEYIRTLRAQLTQYELPIIFFNSLSVLGERWQSENLIMKYRLLKNLPPWLTHSVNPKKYYNMKYDWESKPGVKIDARKPEGDGRGMGQ